jgi:(p)ppGpp synthase/HD superfamily hydrolase
MPNAAVLAAGGRVEEDPHRLDCGAVEDQPFGAQHVRARAALAYARERHAGQKRKCDGAPFITHPLEVAILLRDAGAGDELIAAGLLHDVVEKTGADPAELRRRFGAGIAKLVSAVTEDPAIGSYTARKTALREQVAGAGVEALELFAADKLSKVRELLAYEMKAPTRRIVHYRHSVALLEELLPTYVLTRTLAEAFERLETSLSVGSSDRA